MGIRKFTKKELKAQNKKAIARPEDVRIPIDDSDVYVNEYYLSVSRFFRLFEYIFMVSVILFALGCVMAHPEMMSYNNFLMFVKDIDMTYVDTEKYTELLYDTDYTSEIELYREGAVVPGRDNLFVFTATGRLAYTATHSFSAPRLAASDSAVLVYDFASTSYRIYNSYTEVYKGESEHPIYACAISDSGRYAFVQKKNNGKFGVAVYSAENKHICSFESDKYVVSAALDSEGVIIAVVTHGVKDGIRYSEMKVYDCNTEQKVADNRFDNTYPLLCGFFDDGTSYLVTNQNALFFNREFTSLSEVKTENPSSFSLGENAITLVCGRRVAFIKSDGSVKYNNTFSESVISTASSGDFLFVLGEGRMYKINTGTSEVKEINMAPGYEKILATSERHVIACGVSRASLVDFN